MEPQARTSLGGGRLPLSPVLGGPEPWIWVDGTDGETFDLRSRDPERPIDFALRGSLDAQMWKKAASHHRGKGFEFSADSQWLLGA